MPENSIKNRANPKLGICATIPVVVTFGVKVPIISVPNAMKLFNMWQKIGTKIVLVLI